MSNSIDERVLSMVFDNQKFEKGVDTSLKTLDKLNKSLMLQGAVKGLEDISSKIKNFSVDGISAGIETISSKFNALGAIGFSVINNLTNRVLTFAQSMLGAALDPLFEGGKRRALSIEQAKFQFRGLKMDVEATMASAKAAVLGTAYGLDDAASAAAQFGASGMRAGKEMEDTLRGIAGVAAMSGSSYSEISRIFIGISGATRVYSNDLIQLSSRGINGAAVLAKYMGKSEAAVRKMVTAGEIDFKTFSAAMNDAFGANAAKANETYEGSLSNMRAALSRLGAGFWTPALEKQRDLFNALSPKIDDTAKALLPLLDYFTELAGIGSGGMVKFISGIDIKPLTTEMPALVGGLKNILSIVKNVGSFLLSVFKPLKTAFGEIFSPVSTGQILKLVEAIKLFSDKLKMGDDSADKLRRTFKGVFAILDIGWLLLKTVGKVVTDVLGTITPAGSTLLSLAASLGDWLVKVDEAARKGEIFVKAYAKVLEVLSKIKAVLIIAGGGVIWFVNKIASLISQISKIDTSGVGSFAEKLRMRFQPLTAIGDFLGRVIGRIIDWMGKYLPIIKSVLMLAGYGIKTVIDKIATAIQSAANNLDFNGLTDVFNIGMLTLIGTAIYKFINELSTLSKSGTGIISGIKDIFSGVQGSLEALQSSLKAKTLMTIAGAVALLTLSIIGLSLIDSDRLAAALGAISVLMVELFGSMGVFEKIIKDNGFKSTIKVASAMILLAVAIDLLTIAVMRMASLSWDDLFKGLGGVAVLMGLMVKSVELLGDPKKLKGLASAGVALILFAVAINILAEAVKKLGALDPNTLISGLTGVGVVMAELVFFMKNASMEQLSIKAAASILIMSVAINLLATAVGTFGNMSVEKLVAGLLAMQIVLSEITIFSKQAETMSPKSMSSLLIIGASMLLFSLSLKMIGDMSWDAIGKGVVGFGAALFMITLAMNNMKGKEGQAAAFLVISASLLIISFALERMGNMSWGGIAKAATMLFATMVIITAAMLVMQNAIAGAAAMMIVAIALNFLVPVLQAFGGMSWEEMTKGMIMLGASLIIMALAGVALEPAIPGLLGFGAAVALIGLGFALAGVGMLAFATGLAILGTVAAVGVGAIVVAITAIAALIPFVLTQIGLGLVAFAEAMSTGTVAFAKAFVTMIMAAIIALNETAPAIVDTLVNLLLLLLDAIATMVPAFLSTAIIVVMTLLQAIQILGPAIIQTLVVLIMALVTAIVTLVPFFVDAGMKLIIGILNGIANNIAQMVTAGTRIITEFLRGIGNNVATLVQAGADLIIKVLDGITQGVIDNSERFKQSGIKLATALVDGMTGGMATKAQEAWNAASKLGNEVIAAIKAAFDSHSPSKKTFVEGENLVMGLVNGVDKNAKKAVSSARSLGVSAIKALSDSMGNASNFIDGEINVNPTIRPILDLTDIKNGAGQIDSMFGNKQLLNVGASYINAAKATPSLTSPISVASVATETSSSAPISFTQNNYSPEALSRIDIYRHTKNQIDTMKEVLRKP